MFTLNEIIQAITGKETHFPDLLFTEAIVDSRQAVPGTLFIAVPGERTDGHKFVSSAFAAGARAALIQEDVDGDYDSIDLRSSDDIESRELLTGEKPVCIRVDNSIAALQKIAAYHRTRLANMKVTGITGTVGKTSTKELIYDVLSVHYRTLKTLGNMNNEIGLPLTMLRADAETELAILEMGFYVPGEIDQLCRIALPETGVVTNVGMVHASRAGSMEVIAEGKSELVRALPVDGTAILNYDDPYVRPMADLTKARVLNYGLDPAAELHACNINSRGLDGVYFDMVYRGETYPIHSPLIGRHSVMTALRAAAVGLVYGLSRDEIIYGLENSRNQLRMRLTRTFLDGILIDDTYNASPESTTAALDLLSEIPGRKIAVLGEMRELGQYEQKGHEMVGKKAAAVCDVLVAVGPVTKYMADAAIADGMNSDHVQWFATTDEASDYLINCGLKKDDAILIKGSRGMVMETIVGKLEKKA